MLVGMLILFSTAGCFDSGATETGGTGATAQLERIADEAAFEALLAAAGNRLLVVEFYADWCAPCKLVAPILAEVAWAVGDRADFYAVDVDANRTLARRMGVSGIPNVMLIKKGAVLQRLPGVLAKETYLAAIRAAERESLPR